MLLIISPINYERDTHQNANRQRFSTSPFIRHSNLIPSTHSKAKAALIRFFETFFFCSIFGAYKNFPFELFNNA